MRHGIRKDVLYIFFVNRHDSGQYRLSRVFISVVYKFFKVNSFIAPTSISSMHADLLLCYLCMRLMACLEDIIKPSKQIGAFSK